MENEIGLTILVDSMDYNMERPPNFRDSGFLEDILMDDLEGVQRQVEDKEEGRHLGQHTGNLF